MNLLLCYTCPRHPLSDVFMPAILDAENKLRISPLSNFVGN